MIRIDQLEFRYGEGDFVLHLDRLRIERGTALAVIGPSGSGKTTLLHLIAGVAVPQRGEVTVDSTTLSRLSDAARRRYRIAAMGLVFQEFELLEYLSVLDNILLPYRISGALRLDGDARRRAAALAASVGIGDKARRLATRLSQGEKQRVAVCRALVTGPALLLADEPTGNLDPANRQLVLDMLFSFARETGATLVTVTHDHDRLDRFDRVIDLAGSPAAAEASVP
jgi:putative ABC transport system ATP-binding protein